MKQLQAEITELTNLLTFKEKKVKHIDIDLDKWTLKLHHNGRFYTPEPTAIELHESIFDSELVKSTMGPVGSGKSTRNFAHMIFQAALVPPFLRDGIRRARFGAIRNTYPDLKGSTLKSWMEWFEGFGEVPEDREKHLKQDNPFTFRTLFNDGNGWIDMELVFLALNDPEKDVRKLDSANFTGIFINEGRYMHEKIVERACQRVRRYPDPADIGCELTIGDATMDTNPPSFNSWFYTRHEELKIGKLWKQPPGLIKHDDGSYSTNPEAENLTHLAKDYYLNFAKQMRDEQEINVMVMGQYGLASDKPAVFPEYNDDIHSVDSISYIEGLPIHIGWDFGSTPACVLGQVTPSGRLLAIKEFTTAGGGLQALLEDLVLPYIKSTIIKSTIPKYKIFCYIDPAGFNRTETDAKSAMMTLKAAGFKDVVKAINTNHLEPRLEAVRFPLRRLIEGRGAVWISREGCPVLREATKGEYCKRPIKTPFGIEYGEPMKNFYSHVSDAFQYLCLGVGKLISQDNKPKSTYKPQIIRHAGFA